HLRHPEARPVPDLGDGRRLAAAGALRDRRGRGPDPHRPAAAGRRPAAPEGAARRPAGGKPAPRAAGAPAARPAVAAGPEGRAPARPLTPLPRPAPRWTAP